MAPDAAAGWPDLRRDRGQLGGAEAGARLAGAAYLRLTRIGGRDEPQVRRGGPLGGTSLAGSASLV